MVKPLLGEGILLTLYLFVASSGFYKGIDITSGAGACLGDFEFTDVPIGSGPPLLFLIIMVRCGIPVLFESFPPFPPLFYDIYIILTFICHTFLMFFP